jgi:Flp pilus assembly CpaF family ATPase
MKKIPTQDRVIIVYVPQEVTIPAEHVAELEQSARENWHMPEGAEVADEDLLLAASTKGVIELPEDYHLL